MTRRSLISFGDPPTPRKVVVGEDGQVRLPPGFDVHPGEHLKLVRYEVDESQKKRKSVRGIGVGKRPGTWHHGHVNQGDLSGT